MMFPKFSFRTFFNAPIKNGVVTKKESDSLSKPTSIGVKAIRAFLISI